MDNSVGFDCSTLRKDLRLIKKKSSGRSNTELLNYNESISMVERLISNVRNSDFSDPHVPFLCFLNGIVGASSYEKELRELSSYCSDPEIVKVHSDANFELSLPFTHYIPLTKEFFSLFDDEIYSLFLDFYNHKNHLDYDKYSLASLSGVSYYIPTINKGIIALNKDIPSLDKLEILFHEYGHLVGIGLDDYRYFVCSNLTEIEAYFFELLAQDFLATNLNDSRIDVYRTGNITTVSKMAYSIVSELDFYRERGESALREAYEWYIDNRPEDVDMISNFKYAYSFLVAVELYEMYKQDPKEGIEAFKNIMRAKDNEFGVINEFVNVGDSLDGFVSDAKVKAKRFLSSN